MYGHRPTTEWRSLHRYTETRYDEEGVVEMVPRSEVNRAEQDLFRAREKIETLERELKRLKK